MTTDDLVAELKALFLRCEDPSNPREVQIAAGCLAGLRGSLLDGSTEKLMDIIARFAEEQVRVNRGHITRERASRN